MSITICTNHIESITICTEHNDSITICTEHNERQQVQWCGHVRMEQNQLPTRAYHTIRCGYSAWGYQSQINSIKDFPQHFWEYGDMPRPPHPPFQFTVKHGYRKASTIQMCLGQDKHQWYSGKLRRHLALEWSHPPQTARQEAIINEIVLSSPTCTDRGCITHFTYWCRASAEHKWAQHYEIILHQQLWNHYFTSKIVMPLKSMDTQSWATSVTSHGRARQRQEQNRSS